MSGLEQDDPGLCGRCAHAARQTSRRGSAFWRCRRADTDPAFARYPPLPVRACEGHEPVDDEPPAVG